MHVYTCMYIVIGAISLQERKSEDYEEIPQDVLGKLHELQQQITESSKREKSLVLFNNKLKNDLIILTEEQKIVREQLESIQRPLKGNMI